MKIWKHKTLSDDVVNEFKVTGEAPKGCAVNISYGENGEVVYIIEPLDLKEINLMGERNDDYEPFVV